MKTYCLANPYMRGADLRPLQTALKKAGWYRGTVDGIFGPGSGDACHRAKWALGYPAKNVDRCGGQQLLNYLDGAQGLPPLFRLRRRARGFGLTKEQRLRQAIVDWAHKGVADTAEIHYAEIRPIPHVWQLPFTTDCSGFVTLCYQLAGAPDPNGQGYDGEGYTGTLLDHGTTIPLWQAQPGDVVIWGVPPGHHAALIVDVTRRADPLIVSHGNEDGPSLERLSAESAAQQRPFVVKKYL